MRITFIRPALMPGRSRDALEPVVFGILLGLTPPEVECELFDERIEDVPLDRSTDLVAMSVETYTAKRAYQIAAHYLARDVPVVMGGCHPTLCPDEALQYASTVVIGDAEGVWPALVEDAREGRLQRIYRARYPSLDGTVVDRSIFRGKRYGPVSVLQFGRGCRYACDFCSVHAFYGSNRRWRPISRVVEEIRSVGRKHVLFADDNLFNDRERFETLLEALARERVRWSCQASLDVAADESRVRRMAKAGCMSVMIGFESLDSHCLSQMRKPWNGRYGSYDGIVARLRRHGIMLYGAFVLGYDHDTVASFDATLEFATRSRLFLANFNPLMPLPGAALYDRLRAEDRLLLDPWWLHEDYRYGQVTFEPRNISPAALAEGCYRMRSDFNTWPSIVRRLFDRHANMRNPYRGGIHLLANAASRREIHSKQGRPLGDGTPLRSVFSSRSAVEALASLGVPA